MIVLNYLSPVQGNLKLSLYQLCYYNLWPMGLGFEHNKTYLPLFGIKEDITSHQLNWIALFTNTCRISKLLVKYQ